MDSAYDFDRDETDDEIAGDLLPPVIGGKERRMHVRAYDYWASLLNGRETPAIQDLDPTSIVDFGPHSVLLDFSRAIDDPGVAYLGRALREECGILVGIRTVSDVPKRSLLSRLTDHALEIIANKAPIGFEAEFTNHLGLPTLYRGILLPFTSDSGAIDYVYGVINWKHAAPEALSGELEAAFAGVFNDVLSAETGPIWPEAEAQPELETEPEPIPETRDAGLYEWLAAARISAEGAQQSEGRAHAALYSAIGQAYDFALEADSQPDAYAALLASEGLTVQDRAPMTPIVKLVFGLTYDKTRLTEYAAALTFARRQDVPQGELAAWLESFAGGLKGVVQAERAHRAAPSRPDRSEQARVALRAAPAQAIVQIDAGEDEFVILVARRDGAGQLAILASVTDPILVDKAVRQAAG